MTIRWSNVFVLGMILFALIWGVSHKGELGSFFQTLDHAALSSDPKLQFKGLVSFGLIAVILLAALKIIFSGGDRPGGKDDSDA